MLTQVVIHLLPHEIDWFEWQSKQLKQSSYYLDEEDKILVDVTLNLNLVDWSNSEIPKQFFIDKFNQIKKLYDWAETDFIVDDYKGCLGCNDKRRESILKSKAQNIIYIDTDIIFKPELLPTIINSSKLIEDEYYIITPQIVRLWDNSWDILVNQKYINVPPSKENYENTDPFFTLVSKGDPPQLVKLPTFKFGGGWFNMFSTKLLKEIGIPPELGPYGLDDTFIMVGAQILREQNPNTSQYLIKNTTVIENNKYRDNPYANYLKYSKSQQDIYRSNATNNFPKEIEKLKTKWKK